MKFYNEKNKQINHFLIERQEQLLARQYVTPDSVVLELGARYGSVSCNINKNLANKDNQVSVEPDERVWEALEKNMIRNNCKFHIIKGVISKSPLALTNLDVYLGGYGATTVKSENTTISSFTLEQVESMYNLQFNTLIADCEGFLESFFDENPKLLKQLKLIIFEKDYPDSCNYDKLESLFVENGFTCLVSGHQNVWKKPSA
jgi:FkbM family methyltransferase